MKREKQYRYFIEINEDPSGFWIWRLSSDKNNKENIEYTIYHPIDSRIIERNGIWKNSSRKSLANLKDEMKVREVKIEELALLI